MSMLNNVVGYWAYIWWGAYIQWGIIFGGRAYIWNEVSLSTYGGFIHEGAYIRGGGLYSKVYAIYPF
jgi:hypothetical protein